MRMEDELLADARREAEHARGELIKARNYLAIFQGLVAEPELFATPTGKALVANVEAFMAETTLYPKVEAVGD